MFRLCVVRLFREPNHQHGDIARRHAGNAAGFAEGARLMGGELLPRFDAQAVERHIINALREQLVFRLPEGLDLTMFLFDIARVAQGDVHLLADGEGELNIMRVDFG